MKTNKKSITKTHFIPADLDTLDTLNVGQKSSCFSDAFVVQDDNFRWLPDNSIDFILTDPPYNIAQDTNFHTYENNTINSYRFDKGKGWDSYTSEGFIDLVGQWAEEFNRVLRPGGSFAIFCADTYLSHLMDALQNAGLKPRRTVTWRKPNAVPINRKTMMTSACEYIVVGVKGSKATFNSDLPLKNTEELVHTEQILVADKVASVLEKAIRDNIVQIESTGEQRVKDVEAAIKNAILSATDEALKRVNAMYVQPDITDEPIYFRACIPNYVSYNSKAGNRLHPTEKPVPLLEYFIHLMSRPGDIILDPFGGSGSTGEAALSTNRKVIIIEQDEEFYDKSLNRIKHCTE